MHHGDDIHKELAKLEEAQRRALESLAHAQERVDKRFERLRERLVRKYGGTNDRQQHIISGALELLKRDGLENLSLRKLAQALNMQAPAIYRHFTSKGELVDYMAEAILQQEYTDMPLRAPDEPWQDWLVNHMKRLRRAMLSYPDGARVIAGAHLYPAVTLAKVCETGLESLISAGVAPRTAHTVVMTAMNYTLGDAIEDQAAPTAEQLASFDTTTFLQPFPRMREVMARAVNEGFDTDKIFETGLRYIILGAAADMQPNAPDTFAQV